MGDEPTIEELIIEEEPSPNIPTIEEYILQLEVAEVNRKSKEIEQQILGGNI